MSLTPINRCIDKELKYYGLKAAGLIFGLLALLLIWTKFGIIFGIIAGVIGYIVGDNFSKIWHMGIIQKWCYWHLPTIRIIRNNYLPKSCDRRLL